MKNFIQVVLFLIAIHQVYAQQRVPVPNGPVNSIVRNGNTVYYGGSFNEVGFETGPTALIDLNTNLPSVNNSFPKVNGLIKFSISDGAGGWYVAGDFTSIGGYPIKYLSHLDTNFQVDTMFNSQLNGEVKTIVVDNECLYIGGSFTEIQGIENYYIAKIEKDTGGSFLWNANCNGPVNSMVMFNGNLAVGGNFTSIGGNSRNYFAFIDTYYAQLIGSDYGLNGIVNILFYDQPINSLYVGGSFGSPLPGIFKINSTGVIDNEKYFDNRSDYSVNLGYRKSQEILQTHSNVYFTNNFDTYLNINYNVKNILIVRNNSVASAYTNTKIDGCYCPSYNFNEVSLNEKTIVIDVDFTTDIIGVDKSGDWSNLETFGTINKSFYYTETSRFYLDGSSEDHYNYSLSTTLNEYIVYKCPYGYINNCLAPNIAQNSHSTFFDYSDGFKSSLTPYNFNGVNGFLISQNGALYHCGFNSSGSNYLSTYLLKSTSGLPIGITQNLNNHLLLQGGFNGIFYKDRSNAFAVNTVDGSLLPWSPNPNGPVRALALDASRVYLGGDFTTVTNGAIIRNRLAQVDTLNGVASGWNPGSDGPVNALLWKSGVVYVGGAFSKIGGLTKKCIGALNTITGTATSFNYPMDADATNEVTALAITNDTLFIGGNFKNTTSKHYGVGAVRLNSAIVNYQNALSTDPNATRRVNALAVKNNRLYVGGDFDLKFYSTPTTLVDKHNFAVIDLKTKNTLNYDYNGSGIVTALEATQDNLLYISEVADQVSPTFNSLAVLKSNGTIGWNPRQNGRVNTFCLHNDKVHVGGLFDTINSIFKPNYATLKAFFETNIVSINPLSVCVNSEITLKGKGFNGLKSVKIGGLSLSFVIKSDSVLTLKPITNATGQLSLKNQSDFITTSQEIINVVKIENATITYNLPAAICSGSFKLLKSPFISGVTYQWKKNGVAISGATDSTYSVNSAGSYTVGTSIGSTCKSESPAVSISVETVPSVTISGPSKICWNGRAMFRASVAAGVWAPVDNTLILASPQGLFRNGVKPATDNYKSGVSYTVSSKLGACTTKAIKNVYVRNVIAPSITISSLKSSIKVNETTTATATTNISSLGTWSSTNTLVSATANPLNTKTAFVKGLRVGSGANVVYFADDAITGCRNAGYLAYSVAAASSIVDAPSSDEVLPTSVQLFPNPTNGLVTFNNINGAKSISLVDMIGRTIQAHPLNEGQVTINFNGVVKGKYLVKIEGEQFIETSSLVIE